MTAGAAVRCLTLGAMVLWSAPPTQAQTAPRFVMACAPCHGFDGIGHDPATPHLAGQNTVYLHNQMIAFRTGARKHPEMNFFASQMTSEEMRTIAEYYAKLTR
jgi:cytochrome c553